MHTQASKTPEKKVEYQRAIAERVGCAPERYTNGLPHRVILALHRELIGKVTVDNRVTELRCEIAHHIGMDNPDRFTNKYLRFRKQELATIYDRLS